MFFDSVVLGRKGNWLSVVLVVLMLAVVCSPAGVTPPLSDVDAVTGDMRSTRIKIRLLKMEGKGSE